MKSRDQRRRKQRKRVLQGIIRCGWRFVRRRSTTSLRNTAWEAKPAASQRKTATTSTKTKASDGKSSRLISSGPVRASVYVRSRTSAETERKREKETERNWKIVKKKQNQEKKNKKQKIRGTSRLVRDKSFGSIEKGSIPSVVKLSSRISRQINEENSAERRSSSSFLARFARESARVPFKGNEPIRRDTFKRALPRADSSLSLFLSFSLILSFSLSHFLSDSLILSFFSGSISKLPRNRSIDFPTKRNSVTSEGSFGIAGPVSGWHLSRR